MPHYFATAVLALSVVSCWPDPAFGQDTDTRAPPAGRGFQMAIRSGYAFPFGQASGADGDELSRTFGGQVPILVELGGKIGPYVFLGAYLGLGLGGGGTDIEACRSDNVSCITATFRIGAEVQVHMRPKHFVNPWLGFGSGFESTTLGASGPLGDYTLTAMGPEFARFTFGLDIRPSKTIGFGPYVDLSVASYTSLVTEEVDGRESSKEIANLGVHEWLTVGARFVLFP